MTVKHEKEIGLHKIKKKIYTNLKLGNEEGSKHEQQ